MQIASRKVGQFAFVLCQMSYKKIVLTWKELWCLFLCCLATLLIIASNTKVQSFRFLQNVWHFHGIRMHIHRDALQPQRHAFIYSWFTWYSLSLQKVMIQLLNEKMCSLSFFRPYPTLSPPTEAVTARTATYTLYRQSGEEGVCWQYARENLFGFHGKRNQWHHSEKFRHSCWL